jgi:hypothetical protein
MLSEGERISTACDEAGHTLHEELTQLKLEACQ